MHSALKPSEIDTYLGRVRRSFPGLELQDDGIVSEMLGELARIRQELQSGRRPVLHEDIDRLDWAMRRAESGLETSP